MRFVFFADLHLDSHFAWAPPEVGRQRRQSLRDTLEAIVRLADEVDADAILSGGDLYEHDRFTPDTAKFLQKTFNETSRRVILAPGNHDWLGPESLYHRVSWASHVSVFTENRLRPIELAEGLTCGVPPTAPRRTQTGSSTSSVSIGVASTSPCSTVLNAAASRSRTTPRSRTPPSTRPPSPLPGSTMPSSVTTTGPAMASTTPIPATPTR